MSKQVSKKSRKGKKRMKTTTVIVNQDQTWEELEAVSKGLANGIAKTVILFNNCMDEITKLDPSKNESMFRYVKGVERDMNAIADRFKAIKDQHKDKTGVVSSGEDLVKVLLLFNDYEQLNSDFNTLITDPIIRVTEEIERLTTGLKQEIVNDGISDVIDLNEVAPTTH